MGCAVRIAAIAFTVSAVAADAVAVVKIVGGAGVDLMSVAVWAATEGFA
jgi:hypothetical protein